MIYIHVWNVYITWSKNNFTYAAIGVYIIYKLFDWYLLDL